ncbi:ABC drug efflux pump, inner membrane subunit, DrrB family OS=Tsukamurella paurometabola (strain ATCC 8368 / DSM / CCUG 35730 / CIP 100753 / JCM 10117 /KCTC 9821 / NBRC 16120 / NCIMB 702349 / NCTC 13040) OX=521096 GN=Tpau_2513 PE=4 SV=1 [Tsukamurella paurometabola]|uniref:ABC drug efflux pump, inner membrane subunit, DrrB family n=1 Tax=Tsukamurella paurometabola (strain ATCC 8368 / DSM 20162 / CCUG 35730 / CIP 100753 / JCM 10117 / KCTC 9821 / NBRC 16120 / NCIMB 702349 / NCTC 13040) TaxID=521096 RepID=D5URR2_TSUPD|nr:ABC transporter permease [Tsukamurella paurometabola]ADG79117.1 ABC drug efflux pump, inner membrane subunit, DrrB family [Tsukamurella paurometabola DSM 20162]SUP34141.1 ABC-type transport system involved in multi-copper enzyme maturation, permease component [Tsukamurella paurometabola]
MTSTESRFTAGTFAPAPQPAAPAAMIAAQTRMELTLLLRNGEQLLLTMFIPIALLIGLTVLPIGDDVLTIDTLVPAIMAVAVMSTAFTGQAIAVGFDRRYGALKRLGATPLPKWGVIAGKTLAVVIVVGLQALILGAIGFALGWRPDPVGLVLGAGVLAIGVFAFASLGLLLGGTLKAEVVLALANLLWFVMSAIGSLVVVDRHLPDAVVLLARLSPSGALTEALIRATTGGGPDLFGIAVLLVWGLLGSAAAVRLFRFTG